MHEAGMCGVVDGHGAGLGEVARNVVLDSVIERQVPLRSSLCMSIKRLALRVSFSRLEALTSSPSSASATPFSKKTVHSDLRRHYTFDDRHTSWVACHRLHPSVYPHIRPL